MSEKIEDNKKMRLPDNTSPFFVTESVYNGLCQFIYSDSKEPIRVGDQAVWVEKTLDTSETLLNGGVCEVELMLVNWDKNKEFIKINK